MLDFGLSVSKLRKIRKKNQILKGGSYQTVKDRFVISTFVPNFNLFNLFVWESITKILKFAEILEKVLPFSFNFKFQFSNKFPWQNGDSKENFSRIRKRNFLVRIIFIRGELKIILISLKNLIVWSH